MKKTKLTVFEKKIDKTENKIFWSDDADDFIVIDNEPRQGLGVRAINSWLKRLIANPKLEVPVFSARVVDNLGNVVTPYFTGELEPGHKLAISGDDIVVHKAVKLYNESHGVYSGNLVKYRYRIIDLDFHDQEVSDFINSKYNYKLKGMSLSEALTFNSNIGNTRRPDVTSKYLEFKNLTMSYINTAFQDTEYNDTDVRTVLSAGGRWSYGQQCLFKNSTMPNISKLDIQAVLGEVYKLQCRLAALNAAGTLIDYRGKFSYTAARLVWKCFNLGKTVKIDQFVDFMIQNPDLAKKDRVDPVTGQAIFGYYKRINLGKIEDVYKEIVG